jgi:hypothetical protein
MLTIESATPDAVDELAASIHPDDQAELDAAGLDLRDGITVDFQALRWNGRLVALFGLAGHPLQDGAGIPWMLCTTTLAEVPKRAMAEISRHVVDGWKQQRSHLVNLVHRRNARALSFVRWLGFTVDETPTGPRAEFFTFHWSAHV